MASLDERGEEERAIRLRRGSRSGFSCTIPSFRPAWRDDSVWLDQPLRSLGTAIKRDSFHRRPCFIEADLMHNLMNLPTIILMFEIKTSRAGARYKKFLVVATSDVPSTSSSFTIQHASFDFSARRHACGSFLIRLDFGRFLSPNGKQSYWFQSSVKATQRHNPILLGGSHGFLSPGGGKSGASDGYAYPVGGFCFWMRRNVNG